MATKKTTAKAKSASTKAKKTTATRKSTAKKSK